MKHFKLKIAFIAILSLVLLGLLTSFSFISEGEESISRNVEALSRGEGSSINHCVEAEGKCFINGQTHYGMKNKD